MSRGKRYSGEQKLNLKKVFAVIIIFVAIILFIAGIKNLLKKDKPVESYFTEISYFAVNTDSKWGVINSKGEKLIDNNNEMITIPNNKKDVFICMEMNEQDGTYKTKAINSKNEALFTEYNNVEALSNYDQNKNIWYEDNVLKVQKDGKYGLINLEGNILLQCEYDKISALKGVKNSILIQKNDKFGITNTIGNVIIEPEYIEIKALTDDYVNGYIVKNVEGKYGVISNTKEKILECKYNEIKQVTGNDYYVVKDGDKWNLVTKNGVNPVQINFDDVISINGNKMIVKVSGKYGIYELNNTEKIKPEYDSLEYAFLDYYIFSKSGKYGLINSNGEILINQEYIDLDFNKDADCLIGKKENDDKLYLIDRTLQSNLVGTNLSVHNGYIRLKVEDDYKFYNLKFEEKSNREVFPNNTLFVAKNNGKFGIVNKDGTLVVQYQYDDIKEQNEYGYVAVKKDGKWGAIDQYGNVAAEAKSEISNIERIDFIGNYREIENVIPEYFIKD